MMQYEVQSLRTKLSQTVRKLADKQKEYTTLLSTTRKNKIFAISSPEDLLILELSPENK